MMKNRKYVANGKNGGIIPSVPDERVLYVSVGCQQCVECRKQKARNWQVRIMEDIKVNKNGKFVTFTFSDESIKNLAGELSDKLEGYELDNEIATLAMRRFLERWRKKYKKSLRHWVVTELGHNGTQNIHMHGIVWTDESMDEVEKIWNYGFVWKGKEKNGQLINYVNEKTINYIVKYVHKVDEEHLYYKSKVLTSKGIGSNYLITFDSKRNQYKGTTTDTAYKTRQGYKLALPTYYRNKLYSDEQRERLWLDMLDKNERWVCGERIDVSKGLDEYYKTVDYYRVRNAELGYGTGEKDWSRQQYEQELRNAKILERIERAQKKTDKEKETFSLKET